MALSDQEHTWYVTFPSFGATLKLCCQFLTFECCTEITKSGELAQKRLKFPSFKKESLKTSHWNAGDDMGKIMVILSEGFPRDSVTTPFERVKNVVAFTFRYAPLGKSSVLSSCALKLREVPMVR